MDHHKHIILNGKTLTFEQVIAVSKKNVKVEIGSEALEMVKKCQNQIETWVKEGRTIYGVTTGFGSLASKNIDPKDAIELQKNLLRSHACGVGKNFSKEIVRAILLIRLNTLLKGHSGVQTETIKQIQFFLNNQIHPVIPEQGSVGASGDLCPLSHMALPIIGEGYVEIQNKIIPTKDLKIEGFKPVELKYKEGLALNNGTTVMAALGVIGVYEAEKTLKLATLSTALTAEALGARKQFFHYLPIHILRGHRGQIEIAKELQKLTEGSEFIGLKASEILKNIPKEVLNEIKYEEVKIAIQDNTEGKSTKIPNYFTTKNETWDQLIKFANKKNTPQDSYSIRCSPQVLGASKASINFVKETIVRELNAAVDNPILFPDEKDLEFQVISGGNFHGQPLALVLDHLKLAVAEIGNLIERQINKLVDGNTNDFLPAFLVYGNGLNSGLMIPQYTAASLVSENKVLVHPASADSIPTCENQEDHVSMGPIAGRQALQIIENVQQIISIAFLNNYQALRIRKEQFEKGKINLKIGNITENTYKKIEEIIAQVAQKKGNEMNQLLEKDRFLFEDIKAISANLDAVFEITFESSGRFS